jgi:acyl carrier protein
VRFLGAVEAHVSNLYGVFGGDKSRSQALGRSGRMRQNHQLALVDNNSSGDIRTIRDEISAIFEQVLGRPVVITDDTDIVEDLGMDSLGVMNFVMAIEDFYDLSIPLDRVAQIQTVADLIRAVEDLKSGPAA